MHPLHFLALFAGLCATAQGAETLRVATFNTSLNDDRAGGLIERLRNGDEAARNIAAVIQRQRPDILLINEFDYDADGQAAALFQSDYLAKPQYGQAAIHYAYRYLAPVNTGVPSGLDLNNDGKTGGSNDAFGFGNHPGQYGMLLLSQYPIIADDVRTFQNFLWKDMPNALAPLNADGSAWYSTEAWKVFRLSSKSHWDVPINTPLGTLHFLVSHPTPPAFDGQERRNVKRNHDEIRFWNDYISDRDTPWIIDDQGTRGGLKQRALFIIAGDLNADPSDGNGIPDGIVGLLENPRVLRMVTPRSEGAVDGALQTGGSNLAQRGAHHHDTSAFGAKTGNLRVDYVLPSVGLTAQDQGVFWPSNGQLGSDWIMASDHRMVWVDLLQHAP